MQKMDKSVQITLIIVGTIILLTIVGIILFKSSSAENTISVQGEAVAKVAPDLITVYYNIQTTGKTSKEASDANSLISDSLTNNIIALGFSKDDLKTENYNIYPNYDYNNGQKLTGYTATNSLKIEISVDEKDKLGDTIDAGTNAGAGISYINFELTPALQQKAKTEAIETASADARVKAESLATGFNKKLGRLVSVSLNQFNYSPWNVYSSYGAGISEASDAKMAATNINPSDQEVSAYVTAIYKLI